MFFLAVTFDLQELHFIFIWCRLSDVIVALKEIRLEHEEGAPCTAIREGMLQVFVVDFAMFLPVFKVLYCCV